MKKLLLILSVLFSFSSGLFAFDFFGDRFFEIQAGAKLGLSNNSMLLGDFLQEELVLDLNEIADQVPSSGFNISGNVLPSFHTKLNVAVVSLAVNLGVDASASAVIGKDIFDFLGKGYNINDTIEANIGANVDVFAFANVDVGIKLKKFRLTVTPAVFLPIISTSSSAGTVSVTNDSSGNVTMRYDMNVNVYSQIDIINRAYNIQEMIQNAGYDVSGALTIPFGDKLLATAKARIPMVPGKATYLTNVSSSFVFEGNIVSGNYTQSNTGFELTSGTTDGYSVHRPLKAGLYLDYLPLGNFLDLTFGGGIGIRHPFTDTYKIYPEYTFGLTMNVIKIIKLGLSTEYTDQVFIHQLGLALNLRFLEIDAGVSAQSANFFKSFTGSGFGAYAFATFGF